MWIEQEPQRKTKGRYVICQEEDGLTYSTDSYFWFYFFHNDWYINTFKDNRRKINPMPKKVSMKKIKEQTMQIYNELYDKLLYEYPDKADELNKEFKLLRSINGKKEG